MFTKITIFLLILSFVSNWKFKATIREFESPTGSFFDRYKTIKDHMVIRKPFNVDKLVKRLDEWQFTVTQNYQTEPWGEGKY